MPRLTAQTPCREGSIRNASAATIAAAALAKNMAETRGTNKFAVGSVSNTATWSPGRKL